MKSKNEIESILTEWTYNAASQGKTQRVKDFWLLRYYATGDMSDIFYITNAERKNKILEELKQELNKPSAKADTQKVIDALNDLPIDPFGEVIAAGEGAVEMTGEVAMEVKSETIEVQKELF
jgi:hypothetical protein